MINVNTGLQNITFKVSQINNLVLEIRKSVNIESNVINNKQKIVHNSLEYIF